MNRIAEIQKSMRALPTWVQLWMNLILTPVNLASLLFIATTEGRIAAILAVGGMLPNLPILWRLRGFSKAMSVPHLPFWTILVVWLAYTLTTGQVDGALYIYFIILLVVDTISLGFDYIDSIKYWRGDKKVYGH